MAGIDSSHFYRPYRLLSPPKEWEEDHDLKRWLHRTQAVIYALKKGLISLDEVELP